MDIAGLSQELKESVEVIAQLEGKNEKLKKWAASLFDDRIIDALPLTNAKKKYTKRSFS